MPRLKVEIINADKLIAKLKAMPTAISDPVRYAIINSAIAVHGEAVRSIQHGPGRSGVSYRRGGKIGRRSAPGEPPKSDTGSLAASIRWTLEDDGFGAQVGTDLKYGKYLEFGAVTQSKGARGLVGRAAEINIQGILYPRPWLQPALEKKRASTVKRIMNAVRNALQRFRK